MRYPSLLLLVTIALLTLSGCAAELSPAVVILDDEERQLSGSKPQTHRIELPGNKYFLITVEQLGIDVIVAVRDSDGQRIVAVNTPTERVGSEYVLLKTTKAGAYQLEIRSNEHAEKQGRYRLTVEELAEDTRNDKRRLQAAAAMTEAAKLNFQVASSTGSDVIETLRTDAIDQYEIAQAAWSRLHDLEREAWMLFYMASQYYKLVEYEYSARHAEQAAELFRNADNKDAMAQSLRLQADALAYTLDQGNSQLAVKLLNEVSTIHRSAGRRYDEAMAINTLGKGYYLQSRLTEAREQFVKASNILVDLDETKQAIVLLNNIATTDQQLDKYTDAIESYKTALGISRPNKFQLETAHLLINLASAYAFLGDVQEALLNYREAADLFEYLGKRIERAQALSGIGITYNRMGDWQIALGFFEQALSLQKSAESSALVTIYIKIGNALRNLKRHEEALVAHQKALTLGKLPVEKATAAVELGRDYSLLGDSTSALSYFEKSLSFASDKEAAFAHANALYERGQLRIQQDINVAEGLADLHKAVQEHRTLGSEVGEAQTLQALARAAHKLGRINNAIQYAEEALAITETLRKRVGSPKLRLSFTGMQLPTYELQIALLMELAGSQDIQASEANRYTMMALEVSERARARSLVELLAEAGTDRSQGLDPKLLKAQATKRQELAGLAFSVENLASAGGVEIDNTKKKLHLVQADLDVIEAKIRRQNLEYAELTEPQLLTAAGIQSLLEPQYAEDKETVLLQYSLGEHESFLWCVSKTSIAAWGLPGRAEIEASARKVYDKLKTVEFDHASRAAAQRASAELSTMILEPARKCFNGKRIAIVPHDALQYIPFSALPIISPNGASTPLLERHEVVMLPSASTLALLRESKGRRAPPTKSIAIFADPVFNDQDARFAGKLRVEHHAAARSSEERDRNLLRLPASGREADAIAKLAPGYVFKSTGFAASYANVMATPLADYQFVHFATHGLINSQYPGLSSLALSAIDENGAEQSGFLRLHDIYSMKLNADLVVLSACEAALGKDIRGEGLIGLTRGFMYAGATAVVASLWRASDQATASLMQEFYRLMFQQGLKPAAALRIAQQSISKQRKWRAPYYWAGFILQGDWS